MYLFNQRKQKVMQKGSHILFNYLLLLLLVTFMDIFLCIAEVDYVCNSDPIDAGNRCSHWHVVNMMFNMQKICIAPLIYDNMEHDKKTCEDHNCNYVIKNVSKTYVAVTLNGIITILVKKIPDPTKIFDTSCA